MCIAPAGGLSIDAAALSLGLKIFGTNAFNLKRQFSLARLDVVLTAFLVVSFGFPFG